MNGKRNQGRAAGVRGSMRGRSKIRGPAALLAVSLMVGACGPAPSPAPVDGTGPTSSAPGSISTSASPSASSLPADAVAQAIAAAWRSEPFDPREDDRVSLIDAICNAAGLGLSLPPRDLVDARGESRLVIVYATGATGAAFECFADIGATKASEVQLLQLQDAGGPTIADADIGVGHYGPASFGKIQAMVLVGRVGWPMAPRSSPRSAAAGTRCGGRARWLRPSSRHWTATAW